MAIKVKQGGAYVDGTLYVKQAGAYVAGSVYAKVAGAYVAGGAIEPNEYVQALVTAGWSGSSEDVARLNELSEALMSVPVLATARTANTLLVAPCVGATVAARKMCLFHPSGAGTAMTTALPDANITATGIRGSGSHNVDTAYNGTGLGWQNFTAMVHGRYFQALYADPVQYLLAGLGTTINGDTSIMHAASTRTWRNGSTFSFGNGGYCQSQAFQSGTIGSVCLGTGVDKQRAWRNDTLASQTTETGTYGRLGQSTNTFKLLGNNASAQCSTAEIQTLLIAPGLDNAAYPIAQAAVAAFNAHRATYNDTVSANKRIWIAAGQSNMSGVQTVVSNTANRSGHPLDENRANIKQWLRSGALSDGLHQMDFQTSGAPDNISPMMAMAHSLLAAEPDQQICVIPAAKGSTGFSGGNWNPGNALYEEMLTMTNAAIAAGGQIAGFVWNQGEGDTTLSNRELADAFEAMLADFKSRVSGGWPSGTPVVLGQIANPAGFRDSAMNLVVADVPDVVYVTQAMAGVDLLADAVRFDDLSKIHFSATSQRLMGSAYASAVIA